jgi:hypothetical protein
MNILYNCDMLIVLIVVICTDPILLAYVRHCWWLPNISVNRNIRVCALLEYRVLIHFFYHHAGRDYGNAEKRGNWLYFCRYQSFLFLCTDQYGIPFTLLKHKKFCVIRYIPLHFEKKNRYIPLSVRSLR